MQHKVSLLLAYVPIGGCWILLFAMPAYEVYVKADIMRSESIACKSRAALCENPCPGQECFASCA